MSAKAEAGDFPGRFREIISDPLNLLIHRVPQAGVVDGDHVMLHNGLSVPYKGEFAYYDSFSEILVLNRGGHEPLEEFVFQELLTSLGEAPKMLELGAYWGHYSMWLKQSRPMAEVVLVEPESRNLQAGVENFRSNGFSGEFMQDFVGHGHFGLDQYFEKRNLSKLDILHADIQGYEMELLRDGARCLSQQQIDRIFLSTHSQQLHEDCLSILRDHGYRVEVESDYSSGTTSYDGLIVASNPALPPVLIGLTPMQRIEINQASPNELLAYLAGIYSP